MLLWRRIEETKGKKKKKEKLRRCLEIRRKKRE